MKGLYFYKLTSPYQDDVTKDYKLTVNEIDHNFITLKESDVNDIDFDENSGELILTRLNGEKIKTYIDLSHFTTDFSVEWDNINGVLTFHYNGQTVIIDNILSKVVDDAITDIVNRIISQTITDDTIVGSGIGSDPLGVNPLILPGTYKSVKCVVDKIKGEQLPNEEDLQKGDRFLTYENVNLCGFLYNYNAIVEINQKLSDGWRVPTKDDWDNMLNAIESCDECKNHNSDGTDYYGYLAGKLLKNHDGWDDVKETYNNDGLIENPSSFKGSNNYGMNILPYGHYSFTHEHDGVGKLAEFWTLSENNFGDIWGKAFLYDSNKVKQTTIEKENYYCSLRLVKDYNGQNFKGIEIINGISYNTQLLPTENTELNFTIWTTSNFADDHITDNNNIYRFIENEFLVKDKGYYINEWDGFIWLKKELMNGDAVVIEKGPDDTISQTFQLFDNELINVNEKLKDAITDDVFNRIDNTNENILNKTEVISYALNDLNQKIEDNKILTIFTQQTVDSLSAVVETNQTKINDRVDKEVAELNTRIDNEVDTLNNTLNTLNDDINEKIQQLDIDNNFIFNNTNTISFNVIHPESGGTDVNADINLHDNKIVNNFVHNNIILKEENGLFTHVNVAVNDDILFVNINGNIKTYSLPDVIVKGEYNEDTLELYLFTKLNEKYVIDFSKVVSISNNDKNIIEKRQDGLFSTVNLNYNSETNELTLSKSNNQPSQTIVLDSVAQKQKNNEIDAELQRLNAKPSKTNTIQTSVDKNNNGTTLSSELIVKNDLKNIIKTDEYGVYANVSVSYNKDSNKLIIETSAGNTEITLSSHSLVKNAYYNSATKEIILTIEKDTEEGLVEQNIAIEVNDLMNIFIPNNNDTPIHIQINKTNESGIDEIRATLQLSGEETNLAQINNGALYVKGWADAIYGFWTVNNQTERKTIQEIIEYLRDDHINVTKHVDTLHKNLVLLDNIRLENEKVTATSLVDLRDKITNFNSNLVKYVDDEVKAINTTIDSLSDGVEINRIEINNRVALTEADIQELNKIVATNKTEINERVALTELDIQVLNEIVATNKTEINNRVALTEADIQELSDVVEENEKVTATSLVDVREKLDAYNHTLNTRVDSLSDVVATNKTEINNRVALTEADVQELNKIVATNKTEINERVALTEADVQELNKIVATNKTEINERVDREVETLNAVVEQRLTILSDKIDENEFVTAVSINDLFEQISKLKIIDGGEY